MEIRTSENWLKWLMHELIVENGEIRKADEGELSGQQQLFRLQKLRLVEDLDFVIEGPCASSQDVKWASLEIPMCKTWDSPEKSWLHVVVEKFKPMKILVYAECCCGYDRAYKDLVRKVFPEIEWTFACVPELADRPWQYRDQLAERLLRDRILKVVESVPATN